MSSLLRTVAPSFVSSNAKMTITPIMTRLYSSTKSNNENLFKNAKDTLIETHIHTITVQLISDMNAIKNAAEIKKLTHSLKVVTPYLNHFYNIENNVMYNKYKWNTNEKNSIMLAMKWIGKKPIDIKKQDLKMLSFLVKTRSPIQCERYLQYRIKNKMDGFV